MAHRTQHLAEDDIAVGIDLASETHVVVVSSAQGQRLTRFSIPHSRKGIAELLQRTRPALWGRSGGHVIYAFEATGHVFVQAGSPRRRARAQRRHQGRRRPAGPHPVRDDSREEPSGKRVRAPWAREAAVSSPASSKPVPGGRQTCARPTGWRRDRSTVRQRANPRRTANVCAGDERPRTGAPRPERGLLRRPGLPRGSRGPRAPRAETAKTWAALPASRSRSGPAAGATTPWALRPRGRPGVAPDRASGRDPGLHLRQPAAPLHHLERGGRGQRHAQLRLGLPGGDRDGRRHRRRELRLRRLSYVARIPGVRSGGWPCSRDSRISLMESKA